MICVTTNLAAVNAQRQYKLNTKNKADETEKLTSGYRINKAADDAAGLAISEKMRRLSGGLDQASVNTQDAISLVQLADGAMTEIHDMLQRGRELCVAAANDTLTEQDRMCIQSEIEQLACEIDDLSFRTEFNEIKVLQGSVFADQKGRAGETVIDGALPAWANIGSVANGYMSGAYYTTETFKDANGVETPYTISHIAASIDFSRYDGSDAMKRELAQGGFYTTCCTCNRHYSIKFSEGAGNSVEASGRNYIYTIGLDGINNTNDLLDAIIAGADNGKPNNHYTKLTKQNNHLIVYDDRSNAPSPVGSATGQWINWDTPSFNTTSGNGHGTFGSGVAYEVGNSRMVLEPENLNIQVGSEENQNLNIILPEITSEILGVDNVEVLSHESATVGIERFQRAIDYTSTERSRIGACQNRLEHIRDNLDNAVEQIQGAESRIRDTDMADKTVDYSNQNILNQLGNAMMAQANQSNKSVFELLQ